MTRPNIKALKCVFEMAYEYAQKVEATDAQHKALNEIQNFLENNDEEKHAASCVYWEIGRCNCGSMDNQPDTLVSLNGRMLRLQDLTLENFQTLTGKRYRAISAHWKQIQAGKMTMEESFALFLRNLREAV